MTNRKSTLAPATRKHPPRKRRFNEFFIRKVKAEGATVTTFWDTLQHGLAIRVQPTGHKSWYVVFSRHGRPRWLRLGDANAIYLADARQLAAEAMLQVARGHDPAADRKAERGAGSFSDLHSKYVEQHSRKHNKSWRQADALVRRNLLPKLGRLAANTITRSDVRAALAQITAPIVSNQCLAAASAIFTWGMNNDLIAANPCRGIERNPTSRRERVLVGSNELSTFWAEFNKTGGSVGAALKVILLTGQRPGEVAHMRREHLRGGWWEMPGSPEPHWPGTKNARPHRIFLAAPVRSLIAEQGEGTGFVFGTRGPVRGLDQAMRSICNTLNAPRTTPHDLRRSFLTILSSLKFGRQAMDRIANHADHSVGATYDRHHYSDEDQQIMERVAARIVSLAEGRAADDLVEGRAARNVVDFTR